MVMLRGGYDSFRRMSPEETQRSLERYRRWTEKFIRSGRLASAKKLSGDGVRIVRMKEEDMVLDGPFPESRETVGGLIVIEAGDYKEAFQLVRDCPIFSDGGDIELRKIEEMEI